MNYTYADGSGNKYKLQKFKLSYFPITPDMSSSGTYSGGEPFKIDLERLDLIKLIDVFERALWANKDHTEKRTMGSGIIIKELEGDSQRFYLKYNSDSMTEIDKRFREIKSNL
jgi:hypothetical protein